MAWFELPDGVPLWYEDTGSGPVVLLVPGWTFTTRFYDNQTRDLSRDHRVISLDLRGAGNSGKTPHGHSLSQYADDVLALTRALGLQDVTLVGWAMGVSVSVHALLRDASRFSRLVWVDHSPRFYKTSGWPFAMNGQLDPWTWDAQVRTLQENRPLATRALLETCFAQKPAENELNWMTAELFKTPTEIMATMLATVANVDLRPFLDQLRLPVLLINGRHSMVPTGVGEWIAAQLRDARAVTMEGSAHVPYLEEPTMFNELVREFVAGA